MGYDNIRACAFCNSLLDENRFNDSICSICARKYGIDACSSDDGCACDSR